MQYNEAIEEIKRWKYLTVDSICLPDIGDSISFPLLDASTMQETFVIVISRGSSTVDITLTQTWDFLCKRNDTNDSNIITRFDYAGSPHKDTGSYHVHIGSDERGGQTFAMSDIRSQLGDENDIFLQDAVLLPNAFSGSEYSEFDDDVIAAIRGFLVFVSCDPSDVQNLQIYC